MYPGTKYKLKMFIKNEKSIKIIGFPESSGTQEVIEVFHKEGLDNAEVIEPQHFFNLEDKSQFQYIVSSILDLSLRKTICDELDTLNLDCLTYINDSVYVFPSATIGKGCFIGHQCILSWNCVVGDHCYLGMKSQLGHDSVLGKNCVLSPDAAITGKTTIGENCKFFWRSSVLNNLQICDNVTLYAFSNITKNITDPGVYAGRNAKLIKPKPTDKNL
jgi:carbonic anhydrase/acetyltransferase-like protein (isoleucine patch superfamily)